MDLEHLAAKLREAGRLIERAVDVDRVDAAEWIDPETWPASDGPVLISQWGELFIGYPNDEGDGRIIWRRTHDGYPVGKIDGWRPLPRPKT
mgnify:CR=1 FL=1